MLGIVVSHLLGLVGAVIGGFLGFLIFQWLVGQNFYGLMIPGAMLGLGCSLLAQHRSLARGVVCGLAALLLALYIEWRFWPFKVDGGFKYLVVHFFDLKPITQLMIVLGGVFSYWMGKDASPLFSLPGIARNDQAPRPK
jgi:hypothetical protein